ncbi:MAG: N-acetyltransferase [Bacilli bacterium]|nr:N-acetyltransferase [Bacilli bacterium]
MIIRREEEKDYLEVERLTREAFWDVYRPGCVEHFMLHQMRTDPAFIPELDYVIEEEGRIVANIVYTKVEIIKEDGSSTFGLVFGPISVLKSVQNKGYGSTIIRYTLDLAKEMGYPCVLITGHPDYYHRFGFESATNYGFYYPGYPKKDSNLEDSKSQDISPFFMIKWLASKPFITPGEYHDPSCYSINEEAMQAFDKEFVKIDKLRLV